MARDDSSLDLTDRKRAEESVGESQELLRLVLATLPVGVPVIHRSCGYPIAVQEALTNVIRHARAQRVWIELSQTGDALDLAVREDAHPYFISRCGRHLGVGKAS